MPLFRSRYFYILLPFILLMMVQSAFAQQQPSSKLSQQQQDSIKKESALHQFNNRFGKNDTIWSQVIVYNGDTIPARTLTVVFVDKAMTRAMRRRMEALTRLRNAVYVTYPYARKAGMILNDMNTQLAKMNSESQKKDYIKGKEKELKKETVAFFFGSSLKQSYDAQGDDHNIEVIVQEVERMYRG